MSNRLKFYSSRKLEAFVEYAQCSEDDVQVWSDDSLTIKDCGFEGDTLYQFRGLEFYVFRRLKKSRSHLKWLAQINGYDIYRTI